MGQSIVDCAVNAAMGTLTETHGIEVKFYPKDSQGSLLNLRGVYNKVGIIIDIVGGMPAETKSTTIGFRKSDFDSVGFRQPRIGDIVDVPEIGNYEIYKLQDDDGIEVICGLRGIKNVGTK